MHFGCFDRGIGNFGSGEILKNPNAYGGFIPLPLWLPPITIKPQSGNMAPSKKRRGGAGEKAFVPSVSICFVLTEKTSFSPELKTS